MEDLNRKGKFKLVWGSIQPDTILGECTLCFAVEFAKNAAEKDKDVKLIEITASSGGQEIPFRDISVAAKRLRVDRADQLK